jgi:hypothetical protein
MGTTIIREDGETLTFDATPRLVFSPSVSVTDHPIEDGSVISDHAQAQPLLITISGLVSESPLAVGTTTSGGLARVQAAIEFLRACEGVLVSVVSDRLGTFENCLITRYPHEVTPKRSLTFDVELKQVRIAEAGLVEIPTSNFTSTTSTTEAVQAAIDEAMVAFASAYDTGAQATTSTASEPAQEEQDKSTLLEIAESLGAA